MNHTLANCETGSCDTSASHSNATTFIPRFDIWESDDELRLLGDMPGVTAEDLSVEFEDGQLIVHGTVRPRYGDAKLECREYGIGNFRRSFTIGDAVATDKISAELSNGVLSVHLPKAERAKPRKISVTAG